ncbi:hypothetical protein HY989_06200 [Candidatus Micrarchaeota archaeon]|nr:hypothetical protein [Candidatus Micrarchaeota archaeon]
MAEENFEEVSQMNAELRFLTVELMKIANEKNLSFDQVLTDYFANAYKLKKRIMRVHYPKSYKYRWSASNKEQVQKT